MPQSLRLGERYCFPETYWLPRKARALSFVKRLLQALGIIIFQRRYDGQDAMIGDTQEGNIKWMSLPTQSEREYAKKIATSIRPHFAIASYPWMIPLFDVLGSPVCKRICLHYDIAWQRAEMNAHINGREAEITRTEEAELLARSDLVVDISESDRREVTRMVPGADTLVAPKGFVANPVSDSHSKIVLFVGSGNLFNVEGLTWLLHHVWPTVFNADFEVALHVCGSINHAFQAAIHGVRFFGVVENLTRHYAEAALVVGPLRRATGQNIKIIEAAAFGKAIVATSVAVSSVPELKCAVLCADDAIDFAAAIRRLLYNPSERCELGHSAAQIVNMHFRTDQCYGPLLQWLKHMH